MDSVTNKIVIAGPLGPVFDLATSARFWARWHPATTAVGGVTERPYQLGDRIQERGKIQETEFLVTWRVVEHVRPQRVAIESQKPRARIEYGFREGQGVEFTRTVEYDPAEMNVQGAQRENLRRVMFAQSEQALQQLKALVEGLLRAENKPL
jgi:polyketide cyclase/dehydrase/lipid transport protein